MIFRKISRGKLLLFLGDIFLVVLSLELAFLIRFGKLAIFLGLNNIITLILFMLTACLTSFYIFDLYNIKLKSAKPSLINLMIGSLILVSLFAIVFFYFFPFKLGRGVFIISLIFLGIFTYSWRIFYLAVFKLTEQKRNILIVGPLKKAKAIYSLMKESAQYKVIGLIDDDLKKMELLREKTLLDVPSLEEIADSQKIDDIVVTVDPLRTMKLNQALVTCKMKGINIYDIPAFYEDLFNKLPVSHIKPTWLLFTEGFSNLGSKVYKRLKRMTDLLLSSIILILSSPLVLIIALAIKLNSKGPIFLVQERVGENSELFNLLKFRTMVSGAEKEVPVWAEENDPRVTTMGKILRKMRLDELPQIINVMKGDMSFVGPRPEREYFVKKLSEKIPYYSLRFSVKPGLTGWAQIMYRYGASEEDALEKLQYELYYVKNMSLFLDLKILLKTFRIILSGKGR